ncbi:hypothetical protein [Rheinheimera sp. 4Y26]|uniref:hypothetical protein n=1 Tax=Rheinheimera sp. 4Y26 TaxID=2977811 RepID=UPI0021B0DD6F|nr:hypothetical protein [Rheinheimera sp. 4Y26]MCT6700391.1 hypothetical protein [Rheinheimera sp. 4Y26]
MAHQWRFFRSGGFDQVKLDKIADWQQLDQLDPKLWAALSCPVQGLEFDHRTLSYLDTDHDGRVRIDEVKAAVNWALSVLQQQDVLLTGEALPLSAINSSHEEGQKLLASAKRMLQNLGKADAGSLTVADTADMALIFPANQLNGDGVITAELAQEPEVQQLINTLLGLEISTMDRSGVPGIDKTQLEQFVADGRLYTQWLQQGQNISTIFAENTEPLYQLVQKLDAKITDYFTRCQLAAYDESAAVPLNGAAEDYAALSRQLLSEASSDTNYLPLAHVSAKGLLSLHQGVHPHWAADLAHLATLAQPLWCNTDQIKLAQWQQLKTALATYNEWKAQQPNSNAATLDADQLAACLNEQTLTAAYALMDADLAQQAEAESVLDVDKLVRYQRYLRDLLRNFVNFENFYSLEQPAIFQNGRLYIDGRSCDLCLNVNDAGKHGKIAGLSGTYLLYIDCVRSATGEKRSVVAAMTAGDAGNLMVGRNGVFYDRAGRDWDATVTQIVSNPISIREAFFTPYQRIGRMISDQVQKFAAAKDKEIEAKSAASVGDAAKVAEAPAPAKPAAPFDVAKFAGIFAAIGLAIGAIGTALAAVVTGFLGLLWWQMPLAILGIVLFISGPSMLLAWFKLRARNLAPLLDANGWAVNTNAKLSIKFGTRLTALAAIPAGASRSLIDPYEKKSKAGLWLILLVVVVASWVLWRQGIFEFLLK